MSGFLSASHGDVRQAREALARDGRARLQAVLTAVQCEDMRSRLADAEWRRVTTENARLAVAEIDRPDPLMVFGVLESLSAICHGSGDHGLPPSTGGSAFILDLNADWGSQHGGLLLFADNGRLEGWRPEPGAVTLFDAARPPLLTAVTPGAPSPRLALLGTLA